MAGESSKKMKMALGAESSGNLASKIVEGKDEECSICLEEIGDGTQKGISKLQCGHFFHLSCIGVAFNARGAMVCPNCRAVEDNQWRYSPVRNDNDNSDDDDGHDHDDLFHLMQFLHDHNINHHDHNDHHHVHQVHDDNLVIQMHRRNVGDVQHNHLVITNNPNFGGPHAANHVPQQDDQEYSRVRILGVQIRRPSGMTTNLSDILLSDGVAPPPSGMNIEGGAGNRGLVHSFEDPFSPYPGRYAPRGRENVGIGLGDGDNHHHQHHHHHLTESAVFELLNQFPMEHMLDDDGDHHNIFPTWPINVEGENETSMFPHPDGIFSPHFSNQMQLDINPVPPPPIPPSPAPPPSATGTPSTSGDGGYYLELDLNASMDGGSLYA